MMYFLLIVLCLLKWGTARDHDCDFNVKVQVGRTLGISSPDYPNNYTRGKVCRWIVNCPDGYNCKLTCPDINIPKSKSCRLDQLLVSKTGHPKLVGADKYCGKSTLTAVSTGRRISVGLISSTNSSGGRYRCNVVAQRKVQAGRCSCGRKKRSRIIGGQETGVNEYTMMAGLFQLNQITCGAVIISDKHLLTAAQCVYDHVFGDFYVLVGAHNTTSAESPYTKLYKIEKITPHPNYSKLRYDYDIAVIRTQSNIIFNEGVGPVCLPFKFAEDDFAGQKVTILGWGTTSIGGPLSNVLMKVVVDVISQKDCASKVSSLTPRQMCTYTPGKDACQNDAGGPLLYTDVSTGYLFSVGIASISSCAYSVPSVNTRLTKLLQWVVSTTGDIFCVI